MQAPAGLRSLLLCPAVLRPAADPVWAATPRLLTILRSFRTPATSSVLVSQQNQRQAPRRASPAAAAAAADMQTASRSFAELGLSPGLQSAIAEHNLSEPTDIQVIISHAALPLLRSTRPPLPAMPAFAATNCTGAVGFVQVAAFEEVLRGGDVVLASHTGSGKTLAYLLPLVRRCIAPSITGGSFSFKLQYHMLPSGSLEHPGFAQA
jgi:DEAD/DEAH box helicase